jgi:hypothetical protein
MKHGTAGGYRFYRCPCLACVRANRKDRADRKARRRAQRILVDGRWVAPLPPHYHGKLGTYQEWSCRCIRCTEAATAAHRAYQERRRERRQQQEGSP